MFSIAADRMEALRITPPFDDVNDRPDRVLLSLRLELVRSEDDLSGDNLPVDGRKGPAAPNGQFGET